MNNLSQITLKSDTFVGYINITLAARLPSHKELMSYIYSPVWTFLYVGIINIQGGSWRKTFSAVCRRVINNKQTYCGKD
jgi:hypothetical protein